DMDVDGAFGDMTRAINDMADNLEQGQRDSETSQAHIRNNEILLRSIIDQMPALVSLKDLQGRYLMANKGFETIIGTRREDVIGKTSFEIGLDKAAAQSITLQDRRVLETGVAQFEERKFETESGSYFRNGVKFPVFDANGVMTGIGTVSVDIAERKAIEDQLRQAQKMEVVGQLTGGVAHDFNNLLGVIIGNLDFLGEEIDGNKDQEEYVAIATRASLQAAELTNRLLAFSRRQALSPKIVDLNALIHGMTDLLERTLGETISIRAILPADLKLVLVDASQLETALLNLAVNALHAMPGGGLLTIETCNTELDREYTERHDEVAAGDYVMMAISDTGVGMSSDVLDQVFEPFFTTKDVGEGSGLGLSMVFGFLKQSGGHISIYSEEGEGTTVKLYFPVSKVDTQPSIADSEPAAIPLGSGETVLIVEDNLDLLNMAVKCVSSLGYKTLTALNAQEALTVFGDGAGIDVLFTDVVLPGGVNGVALAKAALERRPTLRVLYTSGYTENAIVHNGVIDDDIVLVEKPYRRETLSYRLREILGGN
ncbi:MAG: PAS domain-containing protein, partial [Rhodospirillaceae bacterium]|nr:PAS domain-containing protein [Rhodospirillaceae bacterium]